MRLIKHHCCKHCTLCTCSCHTYILTDRPSSSCTFLDTRLTFRSADSTGFMEVCDELGQWSTVCGDGLAPGNAFTACNQLGFDPTFPPNLNIIPLNPPVNDGSQPTSLLFSETGLRCLGTEQNLTSCLGASITTTEPPPLPIRRKRIVGEPLACSTAARIGCSGS